MNLEKNQNIKILARLNQIDSKYEKSSQQIERSPSMNFFRAKKHKKSRSLAFGAGDLEKIENFCEKLETEHEIEPISDKKSHNRYKSIDFKGQIS